ncbi:MAG TPA: hypothetical protein VFF23_04050 [Hanamia sp.]|nr:hypothetical protein [Hanamia sp.]
MKIEQVLVHYLLKTKQLTLQGIGTFHLDAAIPDSADSDKPIVIPDNAISFSYDPKATEDEGLVDFIVEHTRKIKPLAASDLDSFLSLGRQFLNIGKPFNLPHIGTLEKQNSGSLIFVPGHQVAQKIEPNRVKQEEDDDAEAQQERFFNEYPSERKSNNSGKTILTLLVIFILGFAVWAVWKYAFTKKQETPHITSTEGIVPVKDSAFKADSATIANSQPVIPAPGDTVQFNIVVNEYHTLSGAERRLKQLKTYNRNVIMYTNDSITYKVAEPFALPLSDTIRILDSLRRYYTKAFVEIK